MVAHVVDFRAPAEVVAALRDGKVVGGRLRAYCPYCDPDQRKRGKLTLVALDHTWHCHRGCHENVQAAAKNARYRAESARSTGREDERKRMEIALEIVERASFISSDDPVDLYLRRRGIPHAFPADLRRARLSIPRHVLPKGTQRIAWAMVGVVRDAAGSPIACHRTFLHEDGRRLDDPTLPRDLRISPTKFLLGPAGHGAIRLGVDSESIAIAEGIESSLGLADATGLVAWSALSALNMEALTIPTWVQRVVIGPDTGDKPLKGRTNGVGIESAMKLRQRLLDDAKRRRVAIDVSLMSPPPGHCDWGEPGIRRGRR